LLERLFVGDALFGGVFADILSDFHRAEVRAAHGAEVRGLCAFLREGFVVKLACGDGVEAEVELSSQRNSKRALLNALSRYCAPGWPLARSAAWAANL